MYENQQIIPGTWRNDGELQDMAEIYRNPGKDTMKSTNLVAINPIHSEIPGTQIIHPILN